VLKGSGNPQDIQARKTEPKGVSKVIGVEKKERDWRRKNNLKKKEGKGRDHPPPLAETKGPAKKKKKAKPKAKKSHFWGWEEMTP